MGPDGRVPAGLVAVFGSQRGRPSRQFESGGSGAVGTSSASVCLLISVPNFGSPEVFSDTG